MLLFFLARLRLKMLRNFSKTQILLMEPHQGLFAVDKIELDSETNEPISSPEGHLL